MQPSRLFTVLLVGALFLPVTTFAQRVYEKDILGTWELVIEIDRSKADGVMERVILNAVSGVLEDVDVRFEFRANNWLAICTNAYGEEEDELGSWHINDAGQLVLDETGNVEIGGVVWLLEGDTLRAYKVTDSGLERDDAIYLRRLN